MFDSGFSELLLIMVVALVVVGPERLPGLARKVGYWVGRFRRYATTVKAEIEREINADELRSMLSRQEDEIRELRDILQDTRDHLRVDIDGAAPVSHDASDYSEHPAARPQQPESGGSPADEVSAATGLKGQADEIVKLSPVPPVAEQETRNTSEASSVDKKPHDRKPE